MALPAMAVRVLARGVKSLANKKLTQKGPVPKGKSSIKAAREKAKEIYEIAGKARNTAAALRDPAKAGRDILTKALKKKALELTPTEFTNVVNKLSTRTQNIIKMHLRGGMGDMAIEAMENAISNRMKKASEIVEEYVGEKVKFNRRDPKEIRQVIDLMANSGKFNNTTQTTYEDQQLDEAILNVRAEDAYRVSYQGEKKPAYDAVHRASSAINYETIREEVLKMTDEEILSVSYLSQQNKGLQDPTRTIDVQTKRENLGLFDTETGLFHTGVEDLDDKSHLVEVYGDEEVAVVETVNLAYGKIDLTYTPERIKQAQLDTKKPTMSPMMSNLAFVKAFSRGMTYNAAPLFHSGDEMRKFAHDLLQRIANMSPSEQSNIANKVFLGFVVFDSEAIGATDQSVRDFYTQVAKYVGGVEIPDELLYPSI